MTKDELTENEQALVDRYRQNNCGDPECVRRRFEAAMLVLLGGKTHDHFAFVIEAAQTPEAER